MAKKEFTYRGKTLEELNAMSLNEFALLIKSEYRRNLKRGIPHAQQVLLDHIKVGRKKLKTHSREMIILPQMVGRTIDVHKGNSYVPVMVTDEMLGRRLGEFAITRKKVQHGSPGIGATKGSKAASVK